MHLFPVVIVAFIRFMCLAMLRCFRMVTSRVIMGVVIVLSASSREQTGNDEPYQPRARQSEFIDSFG
jgi:hypothetical protein